MLMFQFEWKSRNRGHPCLGWVARCQIFAGTQYSVQIIQKSSTRNIMHVSKIVLKLPAKLCGFSDWIDWTENTTGMTSFVRDHAWVKWIPSIDQNVGNKQKMSNQSKCKNLRAICKINQNVEIWVQTVNWSKCWNLRWNCKRN